MKLEHPRTEINIYTGKDPHIISYAFPQMLNQYSAWLHATPLQHHGPRDVMGVLMKPENKKNSVIMSGSSYWTVANHAIPPYKTPYTHFAIAQEYVASLGLISLDPAIQSWADLAGKTINMYLPGSIVNEIFTIVLKFHGLFDRVNKVYVDYFGGRDGLLNGSIHATENAFYKGPGVIAPHETLAHIAGQRAKDLHFISFTPEELEEIARKSIFPVVVMDVKTNELKPVLPSRQKADFAWLTVFHFFGCDAEMEPDIPYEICRVLHEHTKEYALKYHAPAQGWTPQKLAAEAIFPLGGLANCGLAREFFHPGALKYYNEHGIKVIPPPATGKVLRLMET